MQKTCPRCLGEKSIPCQRCNGHGKIVGLISNVDCSECGGTGVVRCPRCWGKGYV